MCPNWCCRAKASQAAQRQTSTGPKYEGQSHVPTFLTIVTGHELGWPVKRLLWDCCPAMNISPTPFLVYWPDFWCLLPAAYTVMGDAAIIMAIKRSCTTW